MIADFGFSSGDMYVEIDRKTQWHKNVVGVFARLGCTHFGRRITEDGFLYCGLFDKPELSKLIYRDSEIVQFCRLQAVTDWYSLHDEPIAWRMEKTTNV